MNQEKYEKVQRCKRINQERLGETKVNKQGEVMFIVEYNSARDIIVQFQSTKELVKCEYVQFKRGTLVSHFTPTVYGVGITGLESVRDNNGETLKSYEHWKQMLRRCYSKNETNKYLPYKDCRVCDEWLYYKNFKKWFNKNYYIVKGRRMNLDKDILIKNNKIYSPETCLFVPSEINSLILRNVKVRGEYPIGVHYDKYRKTFISQCSNSLIRKKVMLGEYNSIDEAFKSYKRYKEKHIKEWANLLKEDLPKKVYDALMSYKVEVTD